MAFLSRLFKGKPSETDGEATTNGAPGKEAAPAPAVAAPGAPASSAVRTVMPKSTAQPVNLRDPGVRQPVALTSTVPPPVVTNRVPSIRPPARKITFPIPSSPRPMAASPQAQASAPAAVANPPAPEPAAPALEAPDATVTLEIGDFIDRLPPNFLNAGPVDRRQTVDFRASELYSDLTKGRASVPASTIYAKVPTIFARPVTDTEDTEVSLPLQKLVEQLSMAFQTRADQVAEENVGEIETPFLQVAKEDGERLTAATGTVSGAIRPTVPLPPAAPTPGPSLEDAGLDFPVRPSHRTGQISTISAPKVPLEAPTAPVPVAGTLASGPINPGKRPPSTVRASVAGGKIRLSGPSAINRISPAPVQPVPAPGAALPPPPIGAPVKPSTASQRIQLPVQSAGQAASPSLAVSKKTARIQIPPISLRAGGQPGVPARPGAIPPPTAVPVQPSPVSIRPPTGTDLPVTFRSSPPPPPSVKPPPVSFAPTLRPNFPPPSFPAVPPAAPAAVAATEPPVAPAPADDRRIELGLAAVLRGIPSEALTVEPWTIADDVRVSLPFAPIEKQLSQGRVSISMEHFVEALPESHRHAFTPDSGLTEVQLPLPEIFQNLPTSALAIRADQVVEETGTLYPTPFSQKADEDAQRFGASPAPVAPEAKAAPTPEPVADITPTPEPVVHASPVEEPAAPEAVEEVAPTPFVDHPLPASETEAPVVPIRDVPLDLDEPRTVEPTASEAPTAVNDLPAEPTVEPPAPVEPAPVEEALAVLESTAPVAEPPSQTAAPEPVTPLNTKPTAAPAEVAPVKGRDSELQTLFMTEEDIDAKVVVRLVCQLPGVSGCAVMFADGLRLAGNFPDGDAEGFSAMTPPFFKRTQNFASELKLGGLKAFTVYTETDLLSFFMHDDICMSVRHSGRGFLPGVREKLEIVTRELAATYSTIKPAVFAADPGI